MDVYVKGLISGMGGVWKKGGLFKIKHGTAFSELRPDIRNVLLTHPPPRRPSWPVCNKTNNSLLHLRSYLFNSLDFSTKMSCSLFMANIKNKRTITLCGQLKDCHSHVDDSQTSGKMEVNQMHVDAHLETGFSQCLLNIYFDKSLPVGAVGANGSFRKQIQTGALAVWKYSSQTANQRKRRLRRHPVFL